MSQPFTTRTESTVVKASVAASVDQCVSVALDLMAYPVWVDGINSVDIVDLDDQGRALRAHFDASAFGRSTSYELDYDYSQLPRCLSWDLHRGDVMRTLTGSYQFDLSEDAPGLTDVTYELKIELAVPLPGFVRRRAEARIVANALDNFASRVEAL